MKKLLFILMLIPFLSVGQSKIRNTQITSGSHPSGKVLKSDGATNVVWGNDSLTVPVKYLQFDTTYVSTGLEKTGTTYWDDANHAYSDVLENGVTGQRYEELFISGQNDTGVTLGNGKVATYASSIGNSGNMRIHFTVASESEPSFMTLGILTQDILNGGIGKITTYGKVRSIQTNGANYGETWVNQDILYKSPTIAGGLTKIPPEAPIPAIPIAIVISAHATNGTLFVRPTYPISLQMLTDVNGTPLTSSGQFPVWNQTNQYFDFTKNINDYELLSNKENTTVDNSTIKYPSVNLLKTYADTKDPSSTNELNSSLTFNTLTNDLTVADAGGNKTANISVNADLLINGYSGTISATANPISFSWPIAYSDTNYYLDIFAHYTEIIDGKSVLIRNAVYDFTKTTTGFSLKLDTLAGVVEYRASRTINSETPANVLLQSDLTTTVGTPGLDTKIPTEKAVRTALSGVVVTETDPVYSAKFDLTGSANGDILKYNGTKYIKFTPNYLTSFTELDPVYSASSWFRTTNNSTNWNTSYTDRLKWDGESTGLTAATGRTSLGGTTIGQAIFTSTNPGAVVFGRANADNTFSWLNAADFKTAIGITTAATSLDLTTSLSANQSYQGVTESGVVGENVAFGDVLYLKFSDGKWWKAKADAYSTTPATRMSLATITANNTGTILIEGNVRFDSWSFAANKVYLSAATAGSITTTQPSTTGNQIQALGIAKTSTTMYFKPSQDVGEK